jgi:RNase P/RNase MRP subunit p30
MIFAEKFCEKIGVFLIQNKAKIRKTKLIITLVFEKDANFFAENWEKSPKIVIITSTRDPQKSKKKKFFSKVLTIESLSPTSARKLLAVTQP